MKENITKKIFGIIIGVLVILSMMICCIQIFCEGSPENTVQLSLEELCLLVIASLWDLWLLKRK